MKPPSEKQAVPEIIEILADLLGYPPKKLRTQGPPSDGYDYLISTPNHRFCVEYKTSASAGALAGAIDQLNEYAAGHSSDRLPLLVVPYMGPVGQELCAKSGISWLDLSGNAKIIAPGLRVHVEGRPNKFSGRGRPTNVFAAKSSRVSRQLLLFPKHFQTQADIVRQTGLDDGYVSKIVRRLDKEEYLDVDDRGAVRPRDPGLLLDAWYETYDFGHNRVIKGHVPARSGDQLLQQVARSLAGEQLQYAATGLSAAWLLTNFAAFRLVTMYLSVAPSRSLLQHLGYVEESKGANLWLVLPNDEGVFQGCEPRARIECVSPVQAYLDLKDQPERASDAAAELRKRLLSWN